VISPKVDGSPLPLRELVAQTAEYLRSVNPDIMFDNCFIERLVSTSAVRKYYGIKQKNAITQYDVNPMSLWCWEVHSKDLLEPYTV
jgi:succinylarginine dihydrolase